MGEPSTLYLGYISLYVGGPEFVFVVALNCGGKQVDSENGRLAICF